MEAAVAKTMQSSAAPVQRMEGGKKKETMARPDAIREKRMKKSRGRSGA
jgi:hypothetical protein